LELCREKIVIVGGILAICAFNELAELYSNVVFNTGEGETNIHSLLRLAHISLNIESFKQLIRKHVVSNVCFYDECHNEIYCSERSVCNLEIQPFSEHNKLADVICNNGLVRMETSRGCPWNKCTFCIMPWKYCGEAWRSFSNEKIEQEIKYLVQNGAIRLWFTDEDFVGNYEHICNLCCIINRCTLEIGYPILFGGSTSVLTLLKLGSNLDTCLQKMYDAGIVYLFIGIESGCDSQLMRYNKGVSAYMNEELIKKLQQYKFEIDYGFIMFDADTTMKELEENLKFIDRAGLRNTISRFAKKLRVTPHTVFYHEYLSRNLIVSGLNINELDYEYIFCDSMIDLIYFYVKKLDQHILKESYKLQALVRSTISEKEKKVVYIRLQHLRGCGYRFLINCVNQYNKNGMLLREDVSDIYEEILKEAVVNQCELGLSQSLCKPSD
ncbi:MAG: radical SAM protein, partial [Lachnospiraceae bacterium]|nr:radical SAM protein [Lachnospiraceae bacterium]